MSPPCSRAARPSPALPETKDKTDRSARPGIRSECARPIGERIAIYRSRRGISQTVLAGLVGRSESWLSQVERGVRSVDRMSVLMEMAMVL